MALNHSCLVATQLWEADRWSSCS